MKINPIAAIVALLLAGTGVALLPVGGPEGVQARVIGVSDGDTLTVRVGDAAPPRRPRVGIDPPGRAPPGGPSPLTGAARPARRSPRAWGRR